MLNTQSIKQYPVVVIGAGPAGLTAAYELAKQHIQPIVIEQADKVGGMGGSLALKLTKAAELRFSPWI